MSFLDIYISTLEEAIEKGQLSVAREFVDVICDYDLTFAQKQRIERITEQFMLRLESTRSLHN